MGFESYVILLDNVAKKNVKMLLVGSTYNFCVSTDKRSGSCLRT